MRTRLTMAIPIIFMLFLPMQTESQSRENSDRITVEEILRFGDAVYLVLTAAGILPDTVTPARAADELKNKNWRIEVKRASEPILLGEFCNLIMYAFKIEGGILYTMYPTPLYAARELADLDFLPIDADIHRRMTGKEGVEMAARVKAWMERW